MLFLCTIYDLYVTGHILWDLETAGRILVVWDLVWRPVLSAALPEDVGVDARAWGWCLECVFNSNISAWIFFQPIDLSSQKVDVEEAEIEDLKKKSVSNLGWNPTLWTSVTKNVLLQQGQNFSLCAFYVYKIHGKAKFNTKNTCKV